WADPSPAPARARRGYRAACESSPPRGTRAIAATRPMARPSVGLFGRLRTGGRLGLVLGRYRRSGLGGSFGDGRAAGLRVVVAVVVVIVFAGHRLADLLDDIVDAIADFLDDVFDTLTDFLDDVL